MLWGTVLQKKGGKALEKYIKIIYPIDGDMLNENDGIVTDGGLLTKVKILAPLDCSIKVNGTVAKDIGEMFLVDILLKDYKNVIEAVETNTGYKQSITVFWLKNYTNKYRLSFDDNIWFLRDITLNANIYRSIFDNPYLAFIKQVHDTYGTRIHINIYYQTDGFNISQMTSKYKNEWKENAGWLRLSFHALQNDPDSPYINADYTEMKRDCERVMEQIKRFAGEELIGPVTTLHWGEATVDGCRALRDTGFKGQVGDFNVDNDLPPVSYYLDVEKRRHINKRFIWKDNQEDIIFVRTSIIINCYKVEEIMPFLDAIKKSPYKSGYMDLQIHEQYFYPFYEAYQSDYRQKVLTSVQWAVDNGYQSAFLSECIFE